MTVHVSVLLPVFNEAAHIGACLDSLDSQEFDGQIDIVVADGGSTDGTLEILAARGLPVIPNPARFQSPGLNRAAEIAAGEILIRADAHTTYSRDYVRRSVEALEKENVVAAGGPLRPEGKTAFGRAVAFAMTSKLGIGPAPFHHSDTAGFVDTVYLGAIRKSDLLEIGGFRLLPFGVAEDADLYWRLRQNGGKVLLEPRISSVYRPRETPASLMRQFYRYGGGKADLLYVNGRWPSLRPLAPLALVAALIAGVVLAAFDLWWPLVVVAASWLATVVVAGRGHPLCMTAVAIMHLSYGTGLVRGLIRRPSKVRAAVK